MTRGDGTRHRSLDCRRIMAPSHSPCRSTTSSPRWAPTPASPRSSGWRSWCCCSSPRRARPRPCATAPTESDEHVQRARGAAWPSCRVACRRRHGRPPAVARAAGASRAPAVAASRRRGRRRGRWRRRSPPGPSAPSLRQVPAAPAGVGAPALSAATRLIPTGGEDAISIRGDGRRRPRPAPPRGDAAAADRLGRRSEAARCVGARCARRPRPPPPAPTAARPRRAPPPPAARRRRRRPPRAGQRAPRSPAPARPARRPLAPAPARRQRPRSARARPRRGADRRRRARRRRDRRRAAGRHLGGGTSSSQSSSASQISNAPPASATAAPRGAGASSRPT